MARNILLVAPPFTPVSKDSIAGIEQVTYMLDKYLTDKGHIVHTVAREDSAVSGNLIPNGFSNFPAASNTHLENFHQAMAYSQHQVRDALNSYCIDVIIDRSEGDTLVTSLEENGPPVLAALDMEPKYYLHSKIFNSLKPNLLPRSDRYVAVSEHIKERYQTELLGSELSDRIETIHNGVITDNFPVNNLSGDYLLYLGRIVSGKAPHLAISAAQDTGNRIVVAGGSLPGHEDKQYGDDLYFNESVKPLLNSSVEWFGPANLDEKVKLLQGAKALLFPAQHIEAQSLVCLESMACGTPVIAYNKSIGPTESVIDMETGFLVDSYDEFLNAIYSVGSLNRVDISNHVRDNFDYAVMGQKYESSIEALFS